MRTERDESLLCLEESGGLPFIVSEVPKKSLILKEGECFVFTLENGDMPHGNRAGLGLYYRDTRYLSTLELKVEGMEPLYLTSSTERGYMANIHLSNPDIITDGGVRIPQDVVNIRRSRVIRDGLVERIHVRNYHTAPIFITLSLSFSSDFADIFEVRGMQRKKRGRVHVPRFSGNTLTLSYTGLDRMKRSTRITFNLKPAFVRRGKAGAEVNFTLLLNPYEKQILDITVVPLEEGEEKCPPPYPQCLLELRNSYQEWAEAGTSIRTDNDVFNIMLQRSVRDLRALYTTTRYGSIIVGGLPWYATPFGRDALITCYQLMIFRPDLARESLRFLSMFQGDRVDDWRDEEPGKIIHEIRQGEMTRTGEIPHSPYYGTVDATPLFLLLLTEYYKWTGDLSLFTELRDSVESALRWVDEYGDMDGDGFVEYSRRSSMGLLNQYWKDSGDSILLPGGKLPCPPIATVETQGYVYYAKRRLAEIYRQAGEEERAERLSRDAEKLRKKVEEHFWDDELDFYVLALDGEKRPVRVVSSNGGQLLFTGLPSPERARAVIRRLISRDMFSGWGIRTLSNKEDYYNPMSYHNGSIWPHDNALILKGIKRYGELEAFQAVVNGLTEASMHMENMRLPELFCGFKRKRFDEPVPYPVACSPQAWSSGCLFLFLQSALGLEPDAARGVLYVNRPFLPSLINRVELKKLRVGEAELDLLFQRTETGTTSFSVLRKKGDIRVVIEE
jgi:glycogen debranching enzyme